MSDKPKFGQMLGQAGLGLAGQAASGVLGMVLGGINDKRQLKQQEKLIGMQLGADMKMTDYNYAKQLQMWKDTNYDAQIEQMKKAGVNPALLYGMSGGGATTTGSGAGASVHAASAPSGGGEIMGMMQLRNQQAQIELLKAQTENLNADTKKTEGVDTELATAQAKNLTASTSYTSTMDEIAKMEKEIAKLNYDAKIKYIQDVYEQANVQLSLMKQDRDMNQQTWDTRKETIEAELLQMRAEIELRNANTQLSNKQIWKISEEVSQGWKKLSLEEKQVLINGEQAKNTKEYNAIYQKLVENITKMNDTPESTKMWVGVGTDFVKEAIKMFGKTGRGLSGTAGSMKTKPF